jgi:hypothetical protein
MSIIQHVGSIAKLIDKLLVKVSLLKDHYLNLFLITYNIQLGRLPEATSFWNWSSNG